ncbi:3-keto-l-gulonate-6-phosphate decarboxylase [Companilactobacillus paralimentarius DSM 13238 = JCM 10415]|uniref:3-hexulose-6-phosphate synthase n=1 Tax=Companilactobacillus paralimentarius DSM 13238 = JCM 10415 TaxID=1122151 RepID=A0A0R1PJ91_9LACO|nr:3-keto-L-gulonate-6-phosphate decarboxylase UlaD [Companilactobacillus paralimentarius]KAE9563838.1 3-keto-L-gulonate-6-phosphate decarboxylase [Companilactobacillus paralimentarius]KRL32422.1 3-keto-l-gulonate-6-phosphate decarboxylase [Companilactobacillus paralimentarius DSM 13238 = JCM 10415]MDR4932872.1 3-keto-L-gulonate-6-phosphate decarboxylase UlaD [Companilactobacillus paralimentarius]QFR69417.1 3-dehydro-L-gulonate-6-phosphate decarboxylase [Companilactobacillus paralimentarius]
MKPNLQVALDNNTLESALADVREVGNIVDIVEAGTILILQEGTKAVKSLKALFPNKTVIADTKCADAGGTVAKNMADAGADWMTCICSATIPTMKAANKEIDEIQVELYGNWTKEDAQKWLDAGISQAVYHQSRDALLSGETWGEKDLNKVKMLVDMGFRVSVTGGLNVDTLKLFKGVDVYTFIAGRAITKASDPAKAATDLQNEIKRIWN